MKKSILPIAAYLFFLRYRKVISHIPGYGQHRKNAHDFGSRGFCGKCCIDEKTDLRMFKSVQAIEKIVNNKQQTAVNKNSKKRNTNIFFIDFIFHKAGLLKVTPEVL